MFEWRLPLRKLLLRLLQVIKKKPSKASVRRNGVFLEHKMRMPIWAVGSLTFFILYWILFLELGLSWNNAIGIFIFVSLLIFGSRFYLHRYSPEIISNNNRLALLSVIASVIVLFMVMVVELKMTIPGISPYIVPIPAAAMLVTILLGSSSAVMIVFALSMILSVLNGFNFNCFFVGFIGGLTGIGSVLVVRNRKDFTHAGLFINIANIL